MAAISKVDPARLGLAANTVHKFYTGFSWEEIQEITKALRRVDKDQRTSMDGYDDFNYPDYGGLPRRIFGRLDSDQVDLLNHEMPTTINQVANTLARGFSR